MNFILIVLLLLSNTVGVSAVDSSTKHNLPNACASDFTAFVYNQNDTKWNKKAVVSDRTVASSGCGFCTVCGIDTTVSGTSRNPYDVFKNNLDQYVVNQGGKHSVISTILGKWGYSVKGIGNNKATFVEYLKAGYLVPAITSSVFTSAGHFVYFYGYKKESGTEYCRVATSSRLAQNDQWFTISTVMGSLNNSASSGGPLWVVTAYSGTPTENGTETTAEVTSTEDSSNLSLNIKGNLMAESEFIGSDNWYENVVAMATKEGLTVNEQKQIGLWGNNIEQSSDNWVTYLRAMICFIGIFITIWCMFIYIAYWLDRTNNFVEFSMLELLSLGALKVSPDNKEQRVDKVYYVNHVGVMKVVFAGVLIGVLIISGKIYTLVSMLFKVIDKIV